MVFLCHGNKIHGNDTSEDKFNKGKCKSSSRWKNCMQLYRLETKWLECMFAKKEDLWVIVDNKLDMNQQCALRRMKVKCIMGCVGESGSRLREVSLPLYCSNHYYNNFVS